jgi:uncharacterized protein YjiS (DUF1127 family)
MTHGSILPGRARLVPQTWSLALQAITNQYRDWAHRRRVYLQTFNELSACSDRDLADLSFSRHDIPGIAAEAARMSFREHS